MLTANEIRQKFLDFFESKKHHIVPSAPLVMKDDPTLMFTNAGMNQFKEYFLESQKAPYPRIADTQKCLRVSGKHNDLEEVGVDTYHHTMFEMLGNWSFDDYFKEEAISWSWELLTQVFGMDPDRIYVTVFEGDADNNVPRDTESYDLWKKFVPEHRILDGSKKDNFWEMGETGPCGPCTEIHYDSRSSDEIAKLSGDKLVNQDHPQVIEIWNNVFIQYDKKKDGSLDHLKGRYVDTGMGLERLVRILQSKHSNYDTDLFAPSIQKIEAETGKKYAGQMTKVDIAIRVLADHIRALCFSITDGQIPSNTGAGYVIRRILRRAVRYYYSHLERSEALLYLLVADLADQYQDVFPELKNQQGLVTDIIKEEEEAFLKTLEKGLKKLDDIASETKDSQVNGAQAFELYDTYGFPLDLTKLILADYEKIVDEKGFETEMKKQKERSRQATALDASDWVVVSDEAESVFVGYDSLSTLSQITRYRKVQDAKREFYQFVMDTTPFYPEGGGQVGDQGLIEHEDQRLSIFDTKKENNQIIHFTKDNPESMTKLQLRSKVNPRKRKPTQANHTATHLLHEALREVLGKHVEQKGSLVSDKSLRFDFSHFQKVTDDQLREIEDRVNTYIRDAHPVTIKLMSKKEADELGAMALFGEKYGEEVRVVMVDDTPSIELCGGTHVKNTSEIAMFKIISESSVAAGVRRVEALTSEACMLYVSEQLDALQKIRSVLPAAKDLPAEVAKLKDQNSALAKELESYRQKELHKVAKDVAATMVDWESIPFAAQVIDGYTVDDLKNIGTNLKSAHDKFLLVLASPKDGKFNVLVMMDPQTQEAKNWDAAGFIRSELAPLMQGGGGGQKFMATGAGKQIIPQEKLISLTQKYFR